VKQFSELVLDGSESDSEGASMKINYAGIGVVAISAIQEQQAIKDLHQKQIDR